MAGEKVEGDIVGEDVDVEEDEEFDEDDELQMFGGGAYFDEDNEFEEDEEDEAGEEEKTTKRRKVADGGGDDDLGRASEGGVRPQSRESKRVFIVYNSNLAVGDESSPIETFQLPVPCRDLAVNDEDESKDSPSMATYSVLPSNLPAFPQGPTGPENKCLYELQQLQSEGGFACWLVGNSVQNDGTVYFATPIDPLFVVLPFFHKSRATSKDGQGYYSPISQVLLSHNKYSATLQQISKLNGFAESLKLICDSHKLNDEEEELFKLNDASVLSWLSTKLDKLIAQLKTNGVDKKIVIQKAISSALRGATTSIKEEDYVITAFGFLSEYVSPFWIEKLAAQRGIDPQTVLPSSLSKSVAPQISADEEEARVGFRSGRARNPAASPSEPEVKKRKSVAQSRLEKVDKRNIPSIASFFGASPKK